MIDNAKGPFMTRAQVIECVRAELGIPVSQSAIDKHSMLGTGPVPVAKYGKTFLYERESALAWARTLIRPAAA